MNLMCFSVYDVKAEAWLRPFFAETKGLALRSFTDAVNEDGHEMNRHAEDYTLFFIGTFNQQTGMLDAPASPEALGTALTFKRELRVS